MLLRRKKGKKRPCILFAYFLQKKDESRLLFIIWIFLLCVEFPLYLFWTLFELSYVLSCWLWYVAYPMFWRVTFVYLLPMSFLESIKKQKAESRKQKAESRKKVSSMLYAMHGIMYMLLYVRYYICSDS